MIKMSDVFELPLDVDLSFDKFTTALIDQQSEYSNVAINSYDHNQAEIADLKSQLHEHDDQIKNIEILNDSISAMQDKRINKLVNENAGLRAQVNLLHDARKEWKGLACNDGITLESIIRILYKTPRQCLASVKADVLVSIHERLNTMYMQNEMDCDDVLSFIWSESNKIREAANENNVQTKLNGE